MIQADGVWGEGKLKAGGVSFVYLEATQGASFVDDNFAMNMSRTGSLKVGTYHSTSASTARQKSKPKTSLDAGESSIGIYVTYYGKYASDPPKSSVVDANLTTLIKLL